MQVLTNVAAQFLRENWSGLPWKTFSRLLQPVHHLKKRSQPCTLKPPTPKRPACPTLTGEKGVKFIGAKSRRGPREQEMGPWVREWVQFLGKLRAIKGFHPPQRGMAWLRGGVG